MKLSEQFRALIREHEGWGTLPLVPFDTWRKWADGAEKLEAEVERLRGALGVWENDSAALPEDWSITEYVAWARKRIGESWRDDEEVNLNA